MRILWIIALLMIAIALLCPPPHPPSAPESPPDTRANHGVILP